MVKLKAGWDVNLGSSVTLAGPTRLLEQLQVDPHSSSLRAAFGLHSDLKYGIDPPVELLYHPTVSEQIKIGPSVDAAGKPYCCIVVRGPVPPSTDRHENVSYACAQI